MPPSKTPISDEAEDSCANCHLRFVDAEIARKMETERAELMEALRKMDAACDNYGGLGLSRKVREIARALLSRLSETGEK